MKNNIKSQWILETRIAIHITIVKGQHGHHDCEENITDMSYIEIITQLYTKDQLLHLYYKLAT